MSRVVYQQLGGHAPAPKTFEGLTKKPHCAACAHAVNHPTPPPPRRPKPMPPTDRRPRAIDTSQELLPVVRLVRRGDVTHHRPGEALHIQPSLCFDGRCEEAVAFSTKMLAHGA